MRCEVAAIVDEYNICRTSAFLVRELAGNASSHLFLGGAIALDDALDAERKGCFDNDELVCNIAETGLNENGTLDGYEPLMTRCPATEVRLHGRMDDGVDGCSVTRVGKDESSHTCTIELSVGKIGISTHQLGDLTPQHPA